MEFDFKDWISSLGKKKIYQNCADAGKILGVSCRTATRLYYGHKPRYYNMYVKIAKNHSRQS